MGLRNVSKTVPIFHNNLLMYLHEMWPVRSLLLPLDDNNTELILHNYLFDYNEGKCISAKMCLLRENAPRLSCIYVWTTRVLHRYNQPMAESAERWKNELRNFKG